MRTVQDIVGNELMSLQLFRVEVEDVASEKALLSFKLRHIHCGIKFSSLGIRQFVDDFQLIPCMMPIIEPRMVLDNVGIRGVRSRSDNRSIAVLSVGQLL